MDLLTSFKNYLFSQEVQPSKVTVKNYLSDINHFVNWFSQKYNSKFIPGQVNAQVLSAYKKDNATVFSSSSMQRHLSSLRKFFKFLKSQEQITFDPFDSLALAQPEIKDYWKLKDFKSSLFDTNAAHLTIKNYIIDVKQFVAWAKESTGLEDSILPGRITKDFIEEYKLALSGAKGFSPASVNRKLSSLRKYLSWAEQQGILSEKIVDFTNLNEAKEKLFIPTADEFSQPEVKAKRYSKFPPLRLAQKISQGLLLAFDATLVLPLASSAKKTQDLIWTLRGKPIFHKNPQTFQIKNITHKDLLGIKNISKKVFAPSTIALSSLSPVQRLVFHARYTRPNWYKRYHSYAITHYFHFAVLIIFIVGLTLGFYNSFFGNQSKISAAPNLPTSPNRILSFQGRLTDSTDNPITSPTNLRFGIYTQQTPGTGSGILLWQEVDQVAPDTDGIFNTLLGNGSACANPISIATGQCAIPSTLFAQNAALFLGVTVESTAELTPRQQIATVAYAANSETLQGLLPITATAAGTTNVVLALDSSGNLTIGGSAAPSFSASGGQFKLSGQPLLLTTNDSSNSNVIISPNGIGKIDVQKPLQNNTLSTNIRSGSNGAFTAAGAVEINDQFAVLATSSGQSAFTVNQDSTGPVISASVSGLPVFTVDNGGNISNSGNYSVAGSGGITISGTGAGITFSGTGNHDISASGGTLRLGALTLNGAITGGNQNITNIGNISANSSSNTLTGFGTIGTAATTNFTGQNLTITGSLSANGSTGNSSQCLTGGPTATWINCSSTTNWWTQTGGVISPIDTSLDFALGGNSTSSADFAVLNLNPAVSTFPLATIAGRLNVSDDLRRAVFGPIATISGRTEQVAVQINNNGNGDLLTASRGGNTKFTIDGRGNIVLGNPTARLSQTTPTISTGNTNATLTLNGDSTGNIQFFSSSNTIDSSGNITLAGTTGLTLSSTGGLVLNGGTIIDNTDEVDINDSLAIANILQVNGTSATTYNRIGTTTTNHSLSSANDLFITGNLEADGTIFADAGLTVGTSQNLTLSGLTGNNQVLYANTSGVVTSVATTSTAGQCLNSGTTTPSWGSCGGYWQLNQGALAPFSDKADLLIGSSATASAKFAFTGLSDLNNRTQASFSGQLIVMPNNGFGNVGINSTNPIGALTVGSGQILVSGGTKTAPDLGLTGSTNTGFYFGSSSGGYAAFTSAGTPKFFFQNLAQRGFVLSNNVSISWVSTSDATSVAPDVFLSRSAAGILRVSGDESTGEGDLIVNGNLSVGTSSPISQLHITRPLTYPVTGKSLVVFDQLENQDIFTASAAGTPKFTISSAGGVGLGGGVGSTPNYGTAGQCLTGGTTASWNTCVLGTNWWSQTNGILYPINTNLDFALGGNSTASADFAILNMNHAINSFPQATIAGRLNVASDLRKNVPNPIATISGRTDTALVHLINNGSGDLLTASQGGNTKFTIDGRGNIVLGNPTARLSQTTPTISTGNTNATLTLNGDSTGNIQFFSSSNNLTSAGALTIASTITANTTNTINGVSINSGTITATALALGTNPAAAGTLRIPNNTYITARNAANNGDVNLIAIDSSNLVSFGANTAAFTLGGAITGNNQNINSIGNISANSSSNTLTGFGTIGTAATTNFTGLNLTLTGSFSANGSTGNSTQCLLGGSTAAWGNCDSTTNWWKTTADGKAITPINSTMDLLVGGITTDSAKFAVVNVNSGDPAASVSGNIALQSPTGNNPATRLNVFNGGSFGIATSVGGNVGLTEKLSLSNTGYLGLNVTSPQAAIHINTSDYDFIRFEGGSYGDSAIQQFYDSAAWAQNTYARNVGGSGYVYDTSNPASRINQSLGTISLETAPTGTAGNSITWGVKAFINNTGNFGINTTTPKTTLDVRANSATFPVASFSGSTTNASLVIDNTGTGNLFAASASGSTRFVIDNNGSASHSGSLLTLGDFGALNPIIQSTRNQTLTLGGSTTGNIQFLPGNSVSSLYLTSTGYAGFGTSAPISQLHVTRPLSAGANGKALAIFDQIENQDIFTASASGTPVITISRAGGIGLGGGVGSAPNYGNASQCLMGGTTVSWGACSSSGGTNWWNQLGGVVSPTLTSWDFALGGNSTSSALFAVLNMNPAINSFPQATIAGRLNVSDDLRRAVFGPIATISGRTEQVALYINNNGNGDLITASRGGNTKFVVDGRGNIVLGNPTARLTQTTPTISTGNTNATLTLNGDSTGNVQFFSSSNNLTSAGALTIASTITANTTGTINGLNINSGSLSGITGYSQTSGTFTMNGSGAVSLGTGTNTVSIGNTTGTLTLAGSGITANTNSVLYSGSTSVIGAATTAVTGLCLSSGANTPTWANCNTYSFWSQLNGTIFPTVNTNDLLLGGNSTASAKFAVLNMDPRINTFPIATIAGRLWVGDDLRRVVAGPIATISGRTSAAALVVNNSGNGDLFSASSSGFSRLVINNSGKIGINNPLPTAYLSIKAVGAGAPALINGYDTTTGTNLAFTINTDSNANGSLDLFLTGTKKVHLVAWGGDNSYILDSNFGLGTSTPTAKLDVAGSASVSGNLAFYGSATNLNQYILNNSKLNFTVSPGGTDGVGDIGDGFSTSNQGQLPQALQLTYHSATSGVVNGTTYIYTLGGENTAGTALSTIYKSRIDGFGNAGAFSSTANALPGVRWGGGTATVTIGSSTYIYYIGGSSGAAATSTAYVATLSNSDGSPGTFATTSPLLGTRLEPAVTTATIGGTTYIYALGGFNSSSVNTSQTSTVYVATVNTNGTLGTFATTSALPASRGGGGARTTTIGGTTYIYYVGGGDTQGRSTVYKASINTNGTLNAFSSVTGLPLNRQEGGTELITVNGTSYIYSIGSGDNSSSTYSAAVYKTALDSSGNPGTWSSTGQSQLPLAFAYVGTTSISSGGTNYIFVLGGNVTGATGNSTVYRAGVFRPAATIANNGYVGIGMSNPAAHLQVDGTTDLSLTAAGSFVIGDLGGPNLGFDSNEIQARSNGATAALYLNHNGGDAIFDGGGIFQVKDSTLRINNTGLTTWNLAQGSNCASGTTKLCFSAASSAKFAFGTNGGLIMGGSLTQNNTPDIAENINVLDTSIEAGDIVSSVIYDSTQESIYDKAVASKANKPYASNIIGAISETPGIVLNAQLSEGLGDTHNTKARPLTIAGRVPIKVSTINGKVKAGDSITSSEIPGMGMKATKAGNILGTALTDYEDDLATQSAVLSNGEWHTENRACAVDEPDCYAYEKVLVLINMSYHDPATELAGIEDLVLKDQTPDANFTAPHYYQLSDGFGKPIEKIGAFAQLCVGYLRVGFIDAQQISTKSLTIATSNVSIAGQSLHDFIANIVSEQLSSVTNLISNNIVSPIAQIDQLHTNIISPVGQNKKIAIKLNDNQGESKLEIQNASGSALASFDSLGNASISGNLSSNNLLVNDNATVSGVLRASKIIADEIEGLNIKTSTIAANYITNNYYVASQGAFPTLPAGNSNNTVNQIAGNYLNIASYSSELASITNLTGDSALFNNSLTVFGQTTLTDTSIVGQLAVGGNLILADESINVLGGDLNLQPLRQGGLSIMAGLIHIDTNGNATFESDATIKGTLFANQIAPLPGKDLNIKLASDSAAINKLVVKGASGAGVLAINNLGDLIASGEASFAKLNINNIVGTAYALSPTEVVASGSAGTVTLKAFKTEVTVNNKLVTPNSLIYITPLGSTANENIYLMRQTPGKSFTVGISNPISQDVKFNFLIVN